MIKVAVLDDYQSAFEEIVDVLFVSYSDFKERRLLEGSSIHDISPFAVFLLLKNDEASVSNSK